jgi:hypothetical protein
VIFLIRLTHSLPLPTEERGRVRGKFQIFLVRFSEVYKMSGNELKKKRLAAEYEEAAEEIKQTNQELEGVLCDGLD